MSIIKSYSVGDGDMYYINHNSDNFTIIDCCLDDVTPNPILDEIATLKRNKRVTRFISTHPDEDHIKGLVDLDDRIGILNFYCVQNDTTKDVESVSFRRYRELHDSEKAFYIYKGCSRYWMNKEKDGRDSSGINLLWPDRNNKHFISALNASDEGNSPNNISPVVKYSLRGGVTAMWMGDLESDFLEEIQDDLQLCPVDLLFAPHHGRESGKIPTSMLNILNPRIIVVGEAPSEHLYWTPAKPR